MNIFTIFTRLRNFIIIIGMLVPITFVYAGSQKTQIEIKGVTPISFTPTPKSEWGFIFSTSTILSDITDPPEAKFILIEKVRKGLVVDMYSSGYSILLQIGDKTLEIETNASTTVYFGNGEKADMSDIDSETKIYVFGYIKSDDSVMLATKIVIANMSRFYKRR